MRILLVEDDLTLRTTMKDSLFSGGFAVDAAASIGEALALLGSESFDAVVLDLGLPDGNGYAVLRHLRQHNNPLPVLILTARDAVEDRVAGLDLGADDYVVKPIALSELQARLRALIRRSFGKSDPLLKLGNLALDTVGKRLQVDGVPQDISAREWAVLEYLVAHAGRIVSKEQMIQAITSLEEDISANAIEAYVSRLRVKLTSAGVAIRTVRGLGYMMEAES
jgi:two-component system OmpR family response regulator